MSHWKIRAFGCKTVRFFHLPTSIKTNFVSFTPWLFNIALKRQGEAFADTRPGCSNTSLLGERLPQRELRPVWSRYSQNRKKNCFSGMLPFTGVSQFLPAMAGDCVSSFLTSRMESSSVFSAWETRYSAWLREIHGLAGTRNVGENGFIM